MCQKLERCKLKIDTIQNVLDGQCESVEIEPSREKNEIGFEASDIDSESYLPLFDSGVKHIDDKYFDESFSKESDDIKDVASARSGRNHRDPSLISNFSFWSVSSNHQTSPSATSLKSNLPTIENRVHNDMHAKTTLQGKSH